MESPKKKPKSSARNNECETSDSDNSYTEDEDDDDESCSDEDDDVISSDDPDQFHSEEFDFDYLASVVKVLEDHAEVNMENSIVLNRKLQETMEELRIKVVSMLNKCREIYEENQQKLANPLTMTSYLKGIGSCGRPFFKDKTGRRCPPNPDYKYRSEIEKEFFPSDLELYPHFTWTARDKVGILQGIKEQAIEYIERKESYEKKLAKTTPLSKKVKLHSLKLNKLLDKVDNDFEIDWNQISVHNLGSRHTANSCLASWNAYLKPEINRDEWTEEENIKLNELAKKYQFQDWIAIASEMPRRSDYQCFVQYQTVVSIKMREDKGERWTKEEDDLLLSLVEKYSMGNVIRWNPICSQLPNRTKKQCFARWKYSINPNISRALFTPEEDCIILAAVEEFGENFNCFPKDLFPNRTVVQIRNRYNNSIKSRGTTRHWSPEDDRLLLDLIAKYGEHDWKNISASIESHTRTSCRTRYLTIAKFFKDNPDATVEDIPRKKRKARSNVTKNNWVETITGLTESNPVKEPVENPSLYRSRLRHNEIQWYNFLKYSYDFRFGEGYSKVPKCLASLEFVRNVFECKLNMPVVLKKGYAKGFVPVSLEKLIRLHDQDEKTLVFERPDVGFKLPPSYSTLLAFRGLCIQASFNGNEDRVEASNIKLPINVIEARNKFRQRLISLLYKTTLLSRLEPKTSVEHNTFEVIFDASTQMGQAAAINLAELKVAQMNKLAENLKIAQQKADKNRQYKEKLKRMEKKKNQNDQNNDITNNISQQQPKQENAHINDQIQIIDESQHKDVSPLITPVNQSRIVELRDEQNLIINLDNSFQLNSQQQPQEIIIDLENSSKTQSLQQSNDFIIELEMPSQSITEEPPVYETLTVADPNIDTKHFPKYKSFATQKANRKRTFEESLIIMEESSQSQIFESAAKIVKREKE
ncbi:uncharacterized protein LOC129917031 [Episyrphus balteatus]|uniref:uncharacterized protein LOC129917031 n=1 Tax=Episyrphus balteatus TaxID=286459 RepID=UPI002486B009|nr:uncharacterized protein LOC129917031 [Episyrphus balteatus]